MPNKIDEGQILIDGVISEKEWKNAINVDLDYEHCRSFLMLCM